MFRELFLGEDEFPVRLGVLRIAVLLVERVNDQRPLDLYRLFLPFRVEHYPPAETADGRFARRIENRVGPIGDDLRRLARLVVFDVQRPNVRLLQAHRSAAREERKQQRENGEGKYFFRFHDECTPHVPREEKCDELASRGA
jgi:hypothetical protein